MAVGAGDMGVMQGKESELALEHRGMSIKLVNQRLMKGDTSDSAIAGVALLAGSEVSNGTRPPIHECPDICICWTR